MSTMSSYNTKTISKNDVSVPEINIDDSNISYNGNTENIDDTEIESIDLDDLMSESVPEMPIETLDLEENEQPEPLNPIAESEIETLDLEENEQIESLDSMAESEIETLTPTTIAELTMSSSGQEYALYIPEGCNADTEIVIFEHGSGPGFNNKELGVFNNYLEKYGSDKIVIVPSNVGTENATEIIEEVRNTYGITNANITSVGYSYGGGYSIEIAAKNIASDSSGITSPQIAFCLDATDNAKGGDETDFIRNPTKAYEEYNLESLKDNTVIFSLEPEGKMKSSTCTSQAYTYYAEQGLNVVRVTCKGKTHEQLLNVFCEDNFLDYENSGELPSEEDGYIYRTFNEETGDWEQIDISGMDYADLCNYLGLEYDSSD